jgi:hypothetical protein
LTKSTKLVYNLMRLDYLLIGLFIITFVGGMAFGFTLAVFTIQTAAGQTPSTAPIVVAPNPTSGLTFLPQQAYVETLRPPQVAQVQPAQASSGNNLTDMLIPILTSLGVTAAATVHSDRKAATETEKVADVVLDNSAEILKGKTVDKEIAKVAFNANPEAAAKITDAPLIKLQTLASDETAFAAKAVKTTLPIPDE